MIESSDPLPPPESEVEFVVRASEPGRDVDEQKQSLLKRMWQTVWPWAKRTTRLVEKAKLGKDATAADLNEAQAMQTRAETTIMWESEDDKRRARELDLIEQRLRIERGIVDHAISTEQELAKLSDEARARVLKKLNALEKEHGITLLGGSARPMDDKDDEQALISEPDGSDEAEEK